MNYRPVASNAQSFLHALVAKGYSPIQLHPVSQIPVGEGWPRWGLAQMNATEISHVAVNANIGLACGAFTIAIDIDSPAALALLGPGLDTYSTVAKVGQKGRTYIFRTNPDYPVRNRKFKSPKDAEGKTHCVVEILALGNQTVLPPSIHPKTGQAYQWVGRSLFDVPHSELPMLPPGLLEWIEGALLANGLIVDNSQLVASREQRLKALPEYEAKVAGKRARYEDYARGLLTAKAASLRLYTENRHHGLYNAVYALGPYVSLGLLTEDEVEAALRAACDANGFFVRVDNHPASKGHAADFIRQLDRGLTRADGLPPVELRMSVAEMFGLAVVGQAVAVVVPDAPVTPHDGPTHAGDFLAYLPDHTFYFRPGGSFWPAASIDDLVPPVAWGTDAGGMPKTLKATKWLARNHALHARTWWPGKPEIIENLLFRDGEAFEAIGKQSLNTYRPPAPPMGNAHDVKPWLDHVAMLYPDHWSTLVRWMAFVAQNPGIKVNWAPVLGGGSRIGKDTILTPLIRAVGSHNWRDVSPDLILKSDFNEYLQCRVLLISEMKDTGQSGTLFQLYNRLKTIIAAPPGTHRINPKGEKPFIIPNLNATAMTTNYRTGGMYLPSDDGRHFVTWSTATRVEIGDDHFIKLWSWLNGGGIENCAAYLMSVDVSDFDSMSVPEKTSAFWDMVNAGEAAESVELGDVAATFNGEAFSIKQLAGAAMMNFANKTLHDWLMDNANARKINIALSDAKINQFRNPGDKQRGRWWNTAENKYVVLYKQSQ